MTESQRIKALVARLEQEERAHQEQIAPIKRELARLLLGDAGVASSESPTIDPGTSSSAPALGEKQAAVLKVIVESKKGLSSRQVAVRFLKTDTPPRAGVQNVRSAIDVLRRKTLVELRNGNRWIATALGRQALEAHGGAP